MYLCKPSLEREAKLFIQEEDDLEETLELPMHEQPTRPPLELKTIPAGLHYAFLNGDSEILSSLVTNSLTRRRLSS